MEQNETKCRFCGRVLVKESKLRICPACMNKYGSGVAGGVGAVVVGGVVFIIRKAGKSIFKL